MLLNRQKVCFFNLIGFKKPMQEMLMETVLDQINVIYDHFLYQFPSSQRHSWRKQRFKWTERLLNWIIQYRSVFTL